MLIETLFSKVLHSSLF